MKLCFHFHYSSSTYYYYYYLPVEWSWTWIGSYCYAQLRHLLHSQIDSVKVRVVYIVRDKKCVLDEWIFFIQNLKFQRQLVNLLFLSSQLSVYFEKGGSEVGYPFWMLLLCIVSRTFFSGSFFSGPKVEWTTNKISGCMMVTATIIDKLKYWIKIVVQLVLDEMLLLIWKNKIDNQSFLEEY